MVDCIFCKITSKEIPTKLVYEDQDIVVFPDIHPVAPVHLLIVSKKHISDFLDVTDKTVFEKLCTVVQKMVKQHGLEDKGYRIVVNGGGAQIINHLHIHLMGPMGKSAKL